MAEYIDFTTAQLSFLLELAAGLGLPSSTSTNKKMLIEHLSAYYKDIDDKFKELVSSYVPASGSAETRQGKLLRMVQRLIYRYYNDGDSFEANIEHYPEPYDELVSEDKELLSEYMDIKSVKGSNASRIYSIRILNMMEMTVERVNSILEPKKDAPPQQSEDEEYVYVLVIELLDPRKIEYMVAKKTRTALQGYINDVWGDETAGDPPTEETFEVIYRKHVRDSNYHKMSVQKLDL